MPKRHESSQEKYIDRRQIVERTDPPSLTALAFKVPAIVNSFDKSFVKQHQEKPDWGLYKLSIYKGNPFIVREMCDRCGTVWIPPAWRKIRATKVDGLGTVYFETGVCKTCINASVYVDKFLDGDPLCETDAKKLFYQYAQDYEKAWRMVIAAAPLILLSEVDWQKACTFFNGCAFCGGPIQVRAKYFPTYLNGSHTPWNVVPLCDACLARHYAGRVTQGKKVSRYKVFSSQQQFNKTKTLRMYLLQQMRINKIYMDPLLPFMERFFETKTLEGSE